MPQLSAASDPDDRERGAVGARERICGALCADSAAVDSAEEAAAGDAVAGVYSIRSERLLMERLECDLRFRWFVGIGVEDAASNHSVFSKNGDRLLEGDIAAKLVRRCWRSPR